MNMVIHVSLESRKNWAKFQLFTTCYTTLGKRHDFSEPVFLNYPIV